MAIKHLQSISAIGESLYYPNVMFKKSEEIIKPINVNIKSLINVKQKETVAKDSNSDNVKLGCYFFFVYNTENYYHFVKDTLPHLLNFLEVRHQYPEVKLLMNFPNESRKEHYRFVLEFLELFDIQPYDIEIIGPYTYQNVFISESVDNPSKIYELFTYIAVGDSSIQSVNIPKIYLSRRTHIHNNKSNIGTDYTNRRKMVNEDELVEYLKTKGYQEVFTELLTVKETIILFAQATDIVAPIGGGLVNVLFSLPFTRLLTIVSPYFLKYNYDFLDSINVVKSEFSVTSHVEQTDFKTGMRIQSGDLVGEITSVNDNRINVIYSDRKVAGWNTTTNYLSTTLPISICQKLDEGLNSSWKINLEEFKKVI